MFSVLFKSKKNRAIQKFFILNAFTKMALNCIQFKLNPFFWELNPFL